MGDLIAKFGAWPLMVWRLAKELQHELWPRVLAMGALAVVALGVASLLGPHLPDGMQGLVSGEATDRLLSMIVSAMLVVTTFSLTVMVSVYANASAQYTPRVHRLITQDKTTQNTLACFIGAYVFALIGIILREVGIFTDERAQVLFAITVLVLFYVVWSLIRWVLHLQNFGSLIDTARQIEDITRSQFEERLAAPCLGTQPWADGSDAPEGCKTVCATKAGYVQQLYHESLDEKACEHNVEVYINAHPGKFVMRGDVLAYIYATGEDTASDTGSGTGSGTESIHDIVQAHFSLGDVRTFDQDPRFGVMVLAEVGCKALSPGINDSGTAIEVISRLARVLSLYDNESKGEKEVRFTYLKMRPLDPDDLMEDAFAAIGRDGAQVIEVQQRLQSTFAQLMRHESADMAQAARRAAVREFRRAQSALDFAPDLERLRASTAPEVLDDVARQGPEGRG